MYFRCLGMKENILYAVLNDDRIKTSIHKITKLAVCVRNV